MLLAGAGKHFSAGADLGHLRSLRDAGEEENLRDSLRLRDLFEAVLRQEALTIALVQGSCVAGGCGLATAHDFVVAAEDARFLYSEVRIGFVAALVATYLPLRLRGSDIRELLLFPRFLEARKALEIGLVNRVVPAADLPGCGRGARRRDPGDGELGVDRPHQAPAARRPRPAARPGHGPRRRGQRRVARHRRLQARHRHLPGDQEAPAGGAEESGCASFFSTSTARWWTAARRSGRSSPRPWPRSSARPATWTATTSPAGPIPVSSWTS